MKICLFLIIMIVNYGFVVGMQLVWELDIGVNFNLIFDCFECVEVVEFFYEVNQFEDMIFLVYLG